MIAGASQTGDGRFDAIICGGGPVGLSFAYLLGRAGLRVALFEKRASTTTLPKGQYVHASTAEFFRQWGVWDRLDKAGWSIERSNGQGFYVNIAQGPVASIRAVHGSDADYIRKWEHLSPAYPRKIPASDYEAAICRQASQWPNVALHFATRVTEVERTGDLVRVEIEQTESGLASAVHARYLIACDGAHSLVRSRLASGQDHGPTFGNQVLVEFRAQLDENLGRDGFFHSFVLDPRYAGWFGSKHPETGLWRYSFRHDEDELPDAAILLERLKGALGMPALAVEIVRVYRFDYSTGLLRKWREGNVLFAGDAAHWHSPWGGFGMNSGVQDANNLAWKLALVAKGIASADLLDTYEVERKSKALLSVKTATYNSLNYQAIVAAVQIGEPTLFSSGEISAAGAEFLRQRVEPHGDNSVLHTGYQLGTVYASRAIIADHAMAPTPTLKDYVESTVPGVRAPHVWLRDRHARRVSLIDLWGPSFVLLVLQRPEHWVPAAEKIARTSGVALRTLHVGMGGDYVAEDAKFLDLYGADGHQAFLVRPDGFIARRFAEPLHSCDSPEDAFTLLADTFGKILGACAGTPTSEAVIEAADGA